MIKVAIINLKGGVGKSVTACNLALGIPRQRPGSRVLVVDLDKQANTTKFFRRHNDRLPDTGDVLLQPEAVKDALRHTDWSGVDLLPASMGLLRANREVQMDCLHAQQNRLAKALALVEESYDLCLMDCPPDIDMATINALCAADEILIPVDCDEWALDGLSEIISQIARIREGLNPKLHLLGCLVTMYTRTNDALRTVEDLVGTGLPVFRTVIHRSTAVRDAKRCHQPVFTYKPRSAPALDYLALADELLQAVSIADTQKEDVK